MPLRSLSSAPIGGEKRLVFVDDHTWVTEGQMRRLLQAVGFGSIEVFGDYDLQPFSDNSRRMILLAQKQN